MLNDRTDRFQRGSSKTKLSELISSQLSLRHRPKSRQYIEESQAIPQARVVLCKPTNESITRRFSVVMQESFARENVDRTHSQFEKNQRFIILTLENNIENICVLCT